MGNNIKEFREKKGWSQSELARQLNVHKSWVHKLETGKKEPTLRMALRMANILECRVEDIFFTN
ncbi:helix-turn-helix transcriptional regulator [Priestia flexa]|uniref:Helix-turn-helix transcriptional regulator n=1 Tax=Priestia flexa TaxID=86664 RepID=A0ABU4J244_9BACI|nr:helix-turn-helix transcriptional regulator [Priestia flexa]MDW8515065.1 helix-turn-helix transcriptional regulator [Priestia flexa]